MKKWLVSQPVLNSRLEVIPWAIPIKQTGVSTNYLDQALALTSLIENRVESKKKTTVPDFLRRRPLYFYTVYHFYNQIKSCNLVSWPEEVTTQKIYAKNRVIMMCTWEPGSQGRHFQNVLWQPISGVVCSCFHLVLHYLSLHITYIKSFIWPDYALEKCQTTRTQFINTLRHHEKLYFSVNVILRFAKSEIVLAPVVLWLVAISSDIINKDAVAS